MFKKILFIGFMLLLFMSVHISAKEVAGINLPETLKAGQDELILNGAGTRTFFFKSIYVGALYLKHPTTDASAIIDGNIPMAIKLHIVSSLITSKKMEKATREGFEKSTGGQMAAIQEQIESFINVFKDQIKVDDVYDIIFIPEEGIKVYKNGEFKASASGIAFKKALFGIWLGNDPVQDHLKNAMLGN